MGQVEFYIVTLVILASINAINVIGLNVQFGTAGLLNLAYIILLAIGAYATGVAALPPSPSHGYVTYIGGFSWPFPWDLLFGMAVTVACGAVLGIIVFTRVSVWYLAVTLTAIGYALLTVINDEPRLFNGYVGLLNVPGPWESQLSQADYQLVFCAISLICLGLIFLLTWRLERSPLGRAWRAIREDETAAMALGKNPLLLKLLAFSVGSLAAGMAGGLTVLYLGSWNTEAWQPNETFLVLAAVIVGGRGWTVGGVVGSLVTYDLLIEGSKYLPVIGGHLALLPTIQTMFLGLIVMAMLWWRPWGLLPEPKERHRLWAWLKEPRGSHPTVTLDG
ncbi:MAG TPA: branched-chain amino acid ABC transporter permease [Candidatus Dormibacteraeota bacterium]|nr:branched-chain amino acid ABC transporter permease [Candidatus Dormibacteraeota bacterium]